MKTNPILDEIRAVRDKDAQLVENDIHRLFSALRSETETLKQQGRKFHSYTAGGGPLSATVEEDSHS